MNKFDVSAELYKKKIIESFRHFGARLYERYGIMISYETYKSILKEDVYRLGANKKRTFVGILNLDGVDILVVKSVDKPYHLLTALPFNNTSNYPEYKNYKTNICREVVFRTE